MAISAADRVINLVFQGDDRVTKTMKGIETNITRFASNVQAGTAPLRNLAEMAVKTQAALTALAIAGMAVATKEAGNFHDATNEIYTLLGDLTQTQMAAFRDDILDYARTSTASIDDINAAIYTAISAGADYKDSLDLLSEAEKLATAGKADLEATIRVLASTMNTYGAQTDEVQRYSDALFTTVEKGLTTMPELGDSLAQVTSIAASAGVPIETLLAAIAALTAQGDPTSQAITKIRGSLVAMIKPSKQAKDAAAALGIEFGIGELKSKGYEVVLREIYDAANGDEEILGKLFGRVEGLSGVLTLGKDAGNKFADALEAMENKTGTVDKQFQKMADNFSNITQNLQNNVLVTVIRFGEQFLDEYRGIADGVSDMFEGVDVAMDAGAFDAVFKMLEKIGKDIGDYIKEIAEVMPEALEDIDFDKFVASIDELIKSAKDLFAAFFGDIDLTTAKGVEDAIQKIVDTFTSLNQVTAGILDALKPFVSLLGEMVDKIVESGDGAKRAAGFIAGLGTALNVIAGGVAAMVPVVSLLAGSTMVNAISNIGKLVGGMTSFANIASGAAAFGIGWYTGKLINEFVPGVKSGTQELIRLADRLLNFTGTVGRAAEKQDEVNREFEEAKEKLKNYQDGIKAASDDLDEFFATVPEFDEFGLHANIIVTAKGDDAKEVSKIIAGQIKKKELDIEAKITSIDDFFDEIDKIEKKLSDAKLTEIDVQLEIEFDDLDEMEERFRKLEDGGPISIDVSPEMIKNKEFEELRVWIEGVGDQVFYVPIEADADTKDASDKIDDLTTPKSIEIKLQGQIDKEIAEIKASAATVQNAVEWEAKLKIAQVEAAAERIKSVMGHLTATIESSGNIIEGIFDKLSGGDSKIRADLRAQLFQERKMREEAHKKSMELTQAEIDLLKRKADIIKKGGGLITIQADGLEPELEAFMWKIIEKVQIRGIEDEEEFLKVS